VAPPGGRELHLWVVVGNAAACAAYDRAGFVATGDQQPVKGDDHRIEERMVVALHDRGIRRCRVG